MHGILRYGRKQIQDVLTEQRSFKDSCRSFSRCHSRLHTHTPMQTPRTPLPLSFLASDSRHPVMTWGVSLAASKAALNRQKYLLWQTDRPSPTMTCMQLSLSLQLLLPALWLDFSFLFFSVLFLHSKQHFPLCCFLTAIICYAENLPTFRTLCLALFDSRSDRGK